MSKRLQACAKTPQTRITIAGETSKTGLTVSHSCFWGNPPLFTEDKKDHRNSFLWTIAAEKLRHSPIASKKRLKNFFGQKMCFPGTRRHQLFICQVLLLSRHPCFSPCFPPRLLPPPAWFFFMSLSGSEWCIGVYDSCWGSLCVTLTAPMLLATESTARRRKRWRSTFAFAFAAIPVRGRVCRNVSFFLETSPVRGNNRGQFRSDRILVIDLTKTVIVPSNRITVIDFLAFPLAPRLSFLMVHGSSRCFEQKKSGLTIVLPGRGWAAQPFECCWFL